MFNSENNKDKNVPRFAVRGELFEKDRITEKERETKRDRETEKEVTCRGR